MKCNSYLLLLLLALLDIIISNLQDNYDAFSIDADDFHPDQQFQAESLERIKKIFYFSYDSYMLHAFPEGELNPLSCTGSHFDLVKIPLLTLIDTLDTLVIMNNYTEFRRAVRLIDSHYQDFAIDVNVSVFETTIRVLGGLISAHLFAVDKELAIYANDDYQNSLLRLATDLGDRLLPAFKTVTGIPYGTVNLMYGVPIGETEIASTAGAGSLLMEFSALSDLTGDDTYRAAALAAMQGIYSRRSQVGLVGKHIHIGNGRWSETISGIGSNSDSFYEYMLKGYLMTHDERIFDMFAVNFVSIKRHLQEGDWFGDVDMFTGKMRRNRVENLHAFWPGVEASIGYTKSAAQLLNAFMAIWQSLGFMPEEMDQSQWRQGKSFANSFYPLRPELIESIFYQFRATRDRSWLIAARLFMQSIENKTKAKCGYASVTNFDNLELMDMQPSFFLSETCKYLYLIFDEKNFIHDRAYIFTTEAHPYDLKQLHTLSNHSRSNMNTSHTHLQPLAATTSSRDITSLQSSAKSMGNLLDMLIGTLNKSLAAASESSIEKIMPRSCSRSFWWDEPASFDPDYLQHSAAVANIHHVVDQHHQSQVTVEDCHKKAIDDVMTAFLSESLLDHRTSSNIDSHRHPLSRSQLYADERVHKVLAAEKSASDIDVDPNEAMVDWLLSMHPKCSLTDSNAIDASAAASQRNTLLQPASPVKHASESAMIQPAQTVELALDGLGSFAVNIFQDGFQIHSMESKSSLEIMNMGQPDIFVREYNESFSEVTIGNIDREVRKCHVSVVNDDMMATWRRSCSIANFGVTSLEHDIVADLTILVDGEGNATDSLCFNASRQYNKSDPINNAPSSTGKQGGWWQSLPFMNHRPQQVEVEAKKQEVVSLKHEGEILLCQRGNCLFEEKAATAQALGAKALIVANTEDALFVMAGSKTVRILRQQATTVALQDDVQVQDANHHDDIDEETTNASNQLPITIPTIMLKRSDVDDLISYLEHSKSNHHRIKLHVSTMPFLLDSEVLGDAQYPKIRVRPNNVQVMTRHGWGVVMVSATGKEWQLFLMKNADLDNIAVNAPSFLDRISPEITPNRVSSTALGVVDSVDVYPAMLAEQCPANIRVSKSYRGEVELHRDQRPRK